MTEWNIVCPDGKTRRPPYEVEKVAQQDAAWFSKGNDFCVDPYLGGQTDCPGGTHKVEGAK